MKLEVLINSHPHDLDFDPASVDAVEVEPGIYSILLDGHSYEVKLEPSEDGVGASVNGHRYQVQVRDPRRLPRTRTALSTAGRQRISSPMPGKVVRVLVGEGDQVVAGQGLLVVEAMKMQNEIRSPKAGRLVALRASEGATVSGGETLAEVE
jgi:biotin carboxyl carrier protein